MFVSSLFVVVYSLSSVDVHCSWYEILVFAVFVVFKSDANDELVDRQMP